MPYFFNWWTTCHATYISRHIELISQSVLVISAVISKHTYFEVQLLVPLTWICRDLTVCNGQCYRWLCVSVSVCVTDSQVVTHVLWPASSHCVPANTSHPVAATSSSYPPRRPPRHLLLYHDGLAQLPVWKDWLLASPWEHNHCCDWGSASVWRHGLGSEVRLVHSHYCECHFVHFTVCHPVAVVFIQHGDCSWRDRACVAAQIMF